VLLNQRPPLCRSRSCSRSEPRLETSTFAGKTSASCRASRHDSRAESSLKREPPRSKIRLERGGSLAAAGTATLRNPNPQRHCAPRTISSFVLAGQYRCSVRELVRPNLVLPSLSGTTCVIIEVVEHLSTWRGRRPQTAVPSLCAFGRSGPHQHGGPRRWHWRVLSFAQRFAQVFRMLGRTVTAYAKLERLC
jgi:hypothetical protein